MQVNHLYENSFPKLTEQYYKTSAWPEAEEIAPYVNDEDPVFLNLYRELCFRHIYARVQGGPTVEQRFESYYNYCKLFNYILSADTPVNLELPNQWLWEIIDEFIYQFQAFSQFRSKLSKKTEDEIEILKRNPKVWNVHSVLNVLHSLVDKSNINKQLEVYNSQGNPDAVAGDFGRHSLYKMLGYFSLVGLLRLHSLLGDFYQAIKVLENIELNKKSLYSRVPGYLTTRHPGVEGLLVQLNVFQNLYGLIEVAQKRVQPEEADKREVSQHLVETVATEVASNRVGISLVVVNLELFVDVGLVHKRV